MTRKEFIQMCGVLGVGMPLSTTLGACSKMPLSPSDKVLIIGAGAAGMSAAYLLQQANVDFEVLEASSTYGGRMKTNKDFADFPIPLGAEWLHVERDIFSDIVNDNSVALDVKTMPYDPNIDFGLYEGQEVAVSDIGFTIDQKFIGATWLTFFEDYILPSIADTIRYNQVVKHIDYSGDKVIVETETEQYTADRIILTVPLKILQVGDVQFTPDLPKKKQEAIDEATVWDGFKAFIEFSEKFYPTFIGFDITPEEAGQKLYYDAAYGQETNQHILGLFAVGTGAQEYASLSDEELKSYMLAELDALFDNQASANYIKHISQNWNEEPFAKGAYMYDYERWTRVNRLADSVDDKIYFAGDAYGFTTDWSSVHVAVRSAKRAVEELV
ncbi:MAG: NAD(P)/FAD-dependent oxidoreductase [Bacteroidota bacterium]